MKKSPEYRRPPRPAEWLLKKIYPDRGQLTSLGDFGEVYNHILNQGGRYRAQTWYWWQVLKSIPAFLKNVFYWRSIMVGNYLKVTVRNIKRHKAYSFINITGLAIGIASCTLIMMWVRFQLSYDKFHGAAPQLYQILVHGMVKNNPSTPAPLAAALKESFPEILEVTRYDGLSDDLLSYKDRRFYESGIRAVDSSFFRMFTFPFLKGDPETALNDLHSIVISEQIAEKFFPDEDPMGKVLTLNNRQEFVVTGIFQNIPDHSTLQFSAVVPFEIRIIGMRELGWELGWGAFVPNTFIKIREDCSEEEINLKIVDLIQKHVEGEDAILSVLPFTQRYLFFSNSLRFIYIFSAIAFFILIIACMNFVNLSTARSAYRAKEIGLRKVTGAFRKNVIFQFLGESLFLSCVALIFAVILLVLVLPLFNALTETELILNISILPQLIGLALFTGIAAGMYPAFFLSRFQPVNVLKGELRSGSKGTRLRKILVVFQFTLSIFLMVGTGVVYRQLDYMRSVDIGYDKEHVVGISLRGENRKLYQTLKNELLRDERILSVAGSAAGLPYFRWSSGTADWPGKDPTKEILTSNNIIDYDFIETLNIEIIEGRSHLRGFSSDIGAGYLVNEEMAKIMGEGSAVGKRLTYWGTPGKVIGVMKNFHFRPLNTQIGPLVLILNPERISFMLIRIQSGDIPSSVEFIQDTWERILPTSPFEYRFLDEAFDRRYRGIERMGNLSNSFAFLAILIACLGLFGLASFAVEQRSKEIGIRKVLGASVSGVFFLLSKEFTKCIVMANLIAWPVAYFAMNKWLVSFAYRTRIGAAVFLGAAFLSVLIAWGTVSYQSIRAAQANPVDSLKYE